MKKNVYIQPQVKVLHVDMESLLAGSDGDGEGRNPQGNGPGTGQEIDSDTPPISGSQAKGFNSAWTTWDD